MLSKVITYGKFGNLYCGVEHTFIDGQGKLNALLLKKKKDEFLIENTFECDHVNNLKKLLNKEQHLFLIINTDQVLSKILRGVFDTQKAIAQAFPNLNIEDFYYEVYSANENTFIAICRKDYINNILLEYDTNHLNVIGFSLGNLAISQLVNLIDKSSIETSNSTVTFVDKIISDIQPTSGTTTTSYNINGLKITKNYTLPLAGIISYYTLYVSTASNFKDHIGKLYNDFFNKRVFDIGLKAGLTTVFVLLLVSFLFFSSYTSNINIITSELELNKTYKNSLLKLSQEVNKKERWVNDFSLVSSKASWYMDQIASSIPNSILLSEIQFQPLVKNIKKEEEILFKKNEIITRGRSSYNNEFTNWVNQLEQQDWIEKVMIQEYGSGKTTITEFELIIEIRN